MNIELGEMHYGDVSEHKIEGAIRDSLDIDTAIELVKDGGGYVSGEYDICITVPQDDDIYETRSLEVYIDSEDALEVVLNELNFLQQQKSNVYRILEETKRELHELKSKQIETTDAGVLSILGFAS
jgi:hypothetical protein